MCDGEPREHIRESPRSSLPGLAMNIEQIYSQGDVRPGESQHRLQTDYTIHNALSIYEKKKEKGGGEKKGVVVNKREKLACSG